MTTQNKQQQLLDLFGLEALTEKTIEVNGRPFTVRIPTVGEMANILETEGGDKHKVNNFALSLVKEFPPEIKWEDVLDMPTTGATAITKLITEVLKTISPSQEEISGN